MNTRWLPSVLAILAWPFGVMLIVNTRAFEAPIGTEATGKVATIAQAQGTILLGPGLITWIARTVTDERALVGVLAGNLLVRVASCLAAGRALLLGILPRQGMLAILIHVALGTAFAVYLRRVQLTSRVASSR